MFEPRREKIMLGLALGLLGALVLDRVVVSPVWAHLAGVKARIAELTAQIAQAERVAQTAPQARRRRRAVERRLRPATEQVFNEFRRYLGAQIMPHAEVTSSAQISAAELSASTGLKRVIYEIQAHGRQSALRQALENLDASKELVRIERLEIQRSSPEGAELGVKVMVSTVCSAADRPDLARGAFAPPGGPPLAALAINIFLPGGQLPGRSPVGRLVKPGPLAEEFLLAGTVISAQRRAALLELPASGQVRWVGLGDRVGMVTVAEIEADGVVFRLGGQRVSLAVGRPGTDLLAGRRVLGGGFELVGVCSGGGQRFAMVQLDEGSKVQRVHLKDRLGSGLVVGISNDGIVLDVDGDHRTVPVGGRFAGKAEL